MSQRSVVLVGGPDSGKTNYVGRLWLALDAQKGSLVAAAQPEEIGFVLDTAEHLFQGKFAPRTEDDERRDLEVTVRPAGGGAETIIVVPDVKGELWRKSVLQSEIDPSWMSQLKSADGALLFLRVLSDQNVRPLDWVTSRRLLKTLGQDSARTELPTQVMLCELVRYLELTLAKRPDGQVPRLSVVVSAWDLIDAEGSKAGPEVYLAKEYPLFAGRLQDTRKLDVQVFGLSVAGGDLTADAEYREAFLDTGVHEHGWVVARDAVTGEWKKIPDVTLPVSWIIT